MTGTSGRLIIIALDDDEGEVIAITPEIIKYPSIRKIKLTVWQQKD